MFKYSFQEKLEAVLRVIDDGMSLNESACILGANKSCVKVWVDMYNQHGIEGLHSKKHTYTGEFKVSVVEYMHTNHLSIRQTAVLFGIPTHNVLSKWERIYYEEGPQGLCQENRGRKTKMSSDNSKNKIDKKTEEDLIAEVQRLRMENDYLKKLQALVQERIARENGKKPEQ